MIPITFAALCVAVAAAESSSVSSHSTTSSNMREYEYPSGTYLTSKPNYSELSASSGGSPYAKSDSRVYSAAESSSDSATSSSQSEPRASSGGSYYKSKYGSDTVVNAIRPSAFHTGSSSSSSSQSSSSQSSSSTPTDIPQNHYPANDYPSTNDYPTSNFGQREQHHPYEVQQPEYAGTRPTGTIYGTYAGAEYPQSRPTAYASGPPTEYAHHPHYATAEDYPSPPPHYKTYVMSSAPSYPTSSKYSTVLGAIKSLFGGGSGGPMLSDAASSATHLSSYSPMGSSPSGYYSPGLMHAATHHMPVAASAPAAAAVGAAPPSYYYGSSLAPSTSAYSKSYAPMRLMTGYGGNGAPGSKVIVVRDSGSAHLGASYQPTAGLLMASSTSYPVKSKISFGPSSGGPTYIASPSSLQSYTSGPSSYTSGPSSYTSGPSSYTSGPPSYTSGPPSYTSGPPSSSFPASYSSSSSFGGGHGGSPFLGYSM